MNVTPKQQVLALLERLPDNCSLAEIQAHLAAYARESEHGGRGFSSSLPSWKDRQADSARAFQAWQALVGI